MDFQQLQENIGKYLILADEGIVKLLCATVIANRIPELDPTWLFVVGSSSGGKSELLLALSEAAGIIAKDDLTPRTFVSGAKTGNGAETSLLFRLPTNAIMVVKDLTVLLTKDTRDAGQIFSQLRMIYDGSFSKSFGTGEDVDVKVRMGLIGGVTSVIEDFQNDEAALGQRAVKYYMKQPPEEDIVGMTERVLSGDGDKTKREMMAQSFREFLDGNYWDTVNIPKLPQDLVRDLSELANLATKSRSSVKRKQYTPGTPIERANLREMPFRFGKQLVNIAKALMIMNGGEVVTPLDRRILYQITLDSIPSSRMQVMMTATKYSRIAVDGLAQETRLPQDTIKYHLEDLVALGVMNQEYSYGANKMFFYLPDVYRTIISRFEDIPMTNDILEEEAPELRRQAAQEAIAPGKVIDVNDDPELQKIINF